MLQGLKQMHRSGECHGDLKIENVMLTSWNWVFITDMAAFKVRASRGVGAGVRACVLVCTRNECWEESLFRGGRGGGGGGTGYLVLLMLLLLHRGVAWRCLLYTSPSPRDRG